MNKPEDKFEDIKKHAGFSPEQWLTLGDQWLLDYGIITPVTHNNIILNLYMNFPKAKYIEYLMDMEGKYIEVHLFFNAWGYITNKEEQLLEKLQELLSQYLKDFQMGVRKKYYGRKARTQKRAG